MRLDEHYGSFDYSKEEWAAIVKCLSAVGADEGYLKGARLGLILAAHPEPPFSIRDHLPSMQIGMRQLEEAIDVVVARTSDWHHDDFDEGRPVQHVMKREAEVVLEPLLRIQEYARRQRASLQRDQEWFDTNSPPASPNWKWYQHRLFSKIATVWSGLGGNIDHGVAYRTFFEAVARPPLTAKHVQERTRCRWSENLFRKHVEHMQRELGIEGSRGPSRNSQTPAEQD